MNLDFFSRIIRLLNIYMPDGGNPPCKKQARMRHSVAIFSLENEGNGKYERAIVAEESLEGYPAVSLY